MRIIDPLWLSILSELFINLSAGYFGVAFITPGFSRARSKTKVRILTNYVALGIVWIIVAYHIRKAATL